MFIEIDLDYLNWIKTNNPGLFNKEKDDILVFAAYVNEVLAAHKNSYQTYLDEECFNDSVKSHE